MTASRNDIGSDLDKVDGYVNGPADYDEMPELDDAFFDRGTLLIGGRPVSHTDDGQVLNDEPRNGTPQLDPVVIAGFKATGPGWQGRINEVLRNWLAKQIA